MATLLTWLTDADTPVTGTGTIVDVFLSGYPTPPTGFGSQCLRLQPTAIGGANNKYWRVTCNKSGYTSITTGICQLIYRFIEYNLTPAMLLRWNIANHDGYIIEFDIANQAIKTAIYINGTRTQLKSTAYNLRNANTWWQFKVTIEDVGGNPTIIVYRETSNNNSGACVSQINGSPTWTQIDSYTDSGVNKKTSAGKMGFAVESWDTKTQYIAFDEVYISKTI